MVETFEPRIHGPAYTGKAAADEGHFDEFHHLLIERGLMTEGETLIGLSVNCAENWIGQVADFFVSCLVVDPAELGVAFNDTGPVAVREVTLRVSPLEFLERFKRFAFTLAAAHSRLHDQGYVVKQPN